MNRTGKLRRTKSSTIAGVASVEPESTTTISAQSRRLSRQLPMQAASLRQITAALRPSTPGAGGSEGRTGVRVAGSVKAIQPSVLASRGPRIARYLGHLLKGGKLNGSLAGLRGLGPVASLHALAPVTISPQ